MPVSVSEYERLAGQMLQLYEEAEQRMIRKVSGHLSGGLSSSKWAERKYAEMSAVRKELQSAVASMQSGRNELAQSFVSMAYGNASNAFVSEAKAFAESVGISGLAKNGQKVAAILLDLNRTLDSADRRILRSANDAYANIVGRASAEVATGTVTVRQAVQRELDAFADKGITSFVDKSGRSWEMSTYAEMATLTAIERATLEGYVDTMQSYGYDLAVISSHAGACPICEAWEGVVVSVSGENREYPSLDDAIADGVFHPRCLHELSTYYDGITKDVRNHPRPVSYDSPAYSARQTQRLFERKIRQWKRRMASAISPQAEREAYAYVRLYQSRLRSLINDYDTAGDSLPRKYWREGGRARLSKAAKMLAPVQLRSKGGKSKDFWSLQERKDSQAAKAYERIRKQDDIGKIARSSGMSEKDIETIKNHIFFDEHQLYDGKGRFDPDYDMAVAWDRLASGKPEKRDILLLNHELLESQIEKQYNISTSRAHEEATKQYDWAGYILKELGEGGEADGLLR